MIRISLFLFSSDYVDRLSYKTQSEMQDASEDYLKKKTEISNISKRVTELLEPLRRALIKNFRKNYQRGLSKLIIK